MHHFWLSRAEYTSKKTLFKRIRSIIKTAAFAKEFLEDLEGGRKFTAAYLSFKASNGRKRG